MHPTEAQTEQLRNLFSSPYLSAFLKSQSLYLWMRYAEAAERLQLLSDTIQANGAANHVPA